MGARERGRERDRMNVHVNVYIHEYCPPSVPPSLFSVCTYIPIQNDQATRNHEYN